VFLAAIRDEEIQKRGVVLVYYMIGQTKFRTDRPSKFADLFWLLPVRLAAMHLCGNSNLHSEIAKRISGNLEAHYLCRFRSHSGTLKNNMKLKMITQHGVSVDATCLLIPFLPYYYIFYLLLLLPGSHLECLYSLMTFGISKDVWPFKDDHSGMMDLEPHRDWLATQRNREKPQPRLISSSSTLSSLETTADSSSSAFAKEISVPGLMEILLGRGKRSKSSAGYLRLRSLVEDHCDAYDKSERYEKVVVVDYILGELRKSGFRFVRATPRGLSEEKDNVVAREKVAHAFRDARRARRGGRSENNNNTTVSPTRTAKRGISEA
jgi:hypothetical protein